MKNSFIISQTLLVLVVIFILSSCKDKNKPDVFVTPTPFIQATVNGTTYTAATQIKVPNKEYFNGNSDYNTSIASNGSYINATFIDSSMAPYYYQNYIVPVNLVSSGDTSSCIFTIISQTPITTGTFNIYSVGTGDTSRMSIQEKTFCEFSYSRTSWNFNDSTVTGTITISKIDMINKVASGTFSLADKGKSGSSPSQVIVEGKFDNLPLQEL